MVLPFGNISHDADDEWVGAGIADTVEVDLRNTLGKTRKIELSRNSGAFTDHLLTTVTISERRQPQSDGRASAFAT